MGRKNCWEFNKCGRGPGGNKSGETGPCPATTEQSCTGLNHGKNAGRICWAVAGTFTTGRISGAFAREISCLNCDFLRIVCKEEGICDFEQLSPYNMYYDGSRMFGRRDLMRIDVHLDLTLRPIIYASYIVGVTINFCREGFSFVSEDFNLESKHTLEFKIKLPDKYEYATVSGDIVWKTRVRDRCLAGVKIREMDEDIKKNILNYSYDIWLKGVQFN